jgi:glucan phosphoethanolaminetransferase (alkaline phosphatase superfamily)
MNQSEIILIFLILAFSLSLIVIMKKDSIPRQILRPLAIFAAFMMICAFGLLIYSFFI